jgi:hypothetical protein
MNDTWTLTLDCQCGGGDRVYVPQSGRTIRCRRCGESLRKGDPLPRRRVSRSSTELRIGRRAVERDRDMGAHVVSIGLWTRAWGLFAVTGSSMWLAVGAIREFEMVVLLLSGGAMLLVGHSLVRLQAWARWAHVAWTCAGLAAALSSVLSQPLMAACSTTWNLAVLCALLSERSGVLFHPGAAKARARDPQKLAYWKSPFMWAPFALAAALVTLSAVLFAMTRIMALI